MLAEDNTVPIPVPFEPVDCNHNQFDLHYSVTRGQPFDSIIRISVARDARAHAQAAALIREAYFRKGIWGAQQQTSLFQTYPDSFTLLAEDEFGQTVGTVSLIFDGPNGLPCDVPFNKTLSILRNEGSRIAEVVQLSIANSYRKQAGFLARMFNLIFIHAFRVRAFDCFLIEVHPRHAAFYQRRLLFQKLDLVRDCVRAGGAPATLLKLNLEVPRMLTRNVAAPHAHGPKSRKTLYEMFLPEHQEPEIARHFSALMPPPNSSCSPAHNSNLLTNRVNTFG